MSRLNITSLAVKNLRRKIVRSLLLFLSVTVVTGTLFSATIFISSMQNALKIGTYRLGADVLVVPEKYAADARSALLAGEPTSFYMNRDILEKVKKCWRRQKGLPSALHKADFFHLLLQRERLSRGFRSDIRLYDNSMARKKPEEAAVR